MSALTPEEAAQRLAANAPVFGDLIAEVSPEQAVWKPKRSQWSIMEVVNHLADEEVEDFLRRLELTLVDPSVPWPSIDPQGWPAARGYLERDLGESIERFLGESARSVAWLLGLSDAGLDRVHEHPSLGQLRAGDLLASWLAHDLIHIRQLTRLHYRWLERWAAPYGTAYAGPF